MKLQRIEGGSLEQVTEKMLRSINLKWEGPNPIDLMVINRLLGTRMNVVYNEFLQRLDMNQAEAVKVTPYLSHIPFCNTPYDGPLDYIGVGFLHNAVDSLTERWEYKPEFRGYVKLSISKDQSLRVEVEDNGTGIINIENLFKQHKSKKDPTLMTGGMGNHLFFSEKFVQELNGKIGYTNKGLNQGAIFWYEVPLESLVVKK